MSKDAPAPKYYEESVIASADDPGSLIAGVMPLRPNKPIPGTSARVKPTPAASNNHFSPNNNTNDFPASIAAGGGMNEPSNLAMSDHDRQPSLKKPPPSYPPPSSPTSNRRAPTNLTEENDRRAKQSAVRRSSKMTPDTFHSPPSDPFNAPSSPGGNRKPFPNEKFGHADNNNHHHNTSEEFRVRPAGLRASDNKKKPPPGGPALAPGAVAVTQQQQQQWNSDDISGAPAPAMPTMDESAHERAQGDVLRSLPQFESNNSNNSSGRRPLDTVQPKSYQSISTITPEPQQRVLPQIIDRTAEPSVIGGDPDEEWGQAAPAPVVPPQQHPHNPNIDSVDRLQREGDPWSSDVDPDNNNNSKQAGRARTDRRYYILSAVFCLLIAGGIAAVVIVVVMGKSSDDPAPAPVVETTAAPVPTPETAGMDFGGGADTTGTDMDQVAGVDATMVPTEMGTEEATTITDEDEVEELMTTTASPTSSAIITTAPVGVCTPTIGNTDEACFPLLQSIDVVCDCYQFCDGLVVGCIGFDEQTSFSCAGAIVAGCTIDQNGTSPVTAAGGVTAEPTLPPTVAATFALTTTRPMPQTDAPTPGLTPQTDAPTLGQTPQTAAPTSRPIPQTVAPTSPPQPAPVAMTLEPTLGTASPTVQTASPTVTATTAAPTVSPTISTASPTARPTAEPTLDITVAGTTMPPSSDPFISIPVGGGTTIGLPFPPTIPPGTTPIPTSGSGSTPGGLGIPLSTPQPTAGGTTSQGTLVIPVATP
ncbi:expressed unknown protein [Seminavis robusta]|uniref:Uncharacterized protein n=1 Tax=Seminavis robusta TaxID=568900 RepID=A0A9N8HU19_9STRA|nr:expressed unknown protein [Seminavis robusta]|eukprot:Sro1336_g264040.1 n/a (759) ;mRNA; f:18613-20889